MKSVLTNPLNGKGELIWLEDGFTEKNWPNTPDFGNGLKQICYEIIKQQKGNIIDCGAHIGDFSIPLACALREDGIDLTVYAIDPDLNKCNHIKKLAALNNLTNIEIMQAGVTDKQCSYKIHPGSLDFENITCPEQGWPINTGGRVYIECDDDDPNKEMTFTTFDALLKEGLIKDVGFVYLDVEHNEPHTLKGSKQLINKCKPIILFEYHPVENKETEARIPGTLEFYKENDKELRDIVESLNMFIPRNYCSTIDGEVLFNNDSAVGDLLLVSRP